MTLQIDPVRDHVIFTFVEDISNERFINSTSSGILTTSNSLEQTNHPRWVKIHAVGPKAYDVKPGDYALVEAGKWTNQFVVDGTRYWKTDESQLLAVSDQPGATY